MPHGLHHLLNSSGEFLNRAGVYFLKLGNAVIDGGLNFGNAGVYPFVDDFFFLGTDFVFVEEAVHEAETAHPIFHQVLPAHPQVY